MKFTPHQYQKEAIKMLLKEPGSGLFLDPGEGKTSCTLAAMDILKKKKMVKGVLVLATLNIIQLETWQDEIKKWGFNFTSTVLHGTHKDKRLKENVDIYLMNYEGLHWLYQNRKLVATKMDVIVLDESSKVKSFRSQRFKILKKMLPMFNRRHLLTGTPAAQSLMDLFSQVYILDQGERLGQYITHYRNEYFYPCGFKGYQYELQDGGKERIYKKIDDIIFRPAEDYLKIPKEIYNDVVIKLPRKIMKQYEELENEFIAELDEGIVTAVNAGAKASKLRQFSNGCVYGEDGKVLQVHSHKIEAAVDIVDELQGNPVIIGYEFKHELEELLKAFPKAPYIGTRLNGQKPNAKTKKKIKDDWNMGCIPVLIGQISSIAHGLNIQESGHNIIMFSHIYKLEDVIQFIRRLRRQGQKKRVVVHRLICKDTVDLDVINVLKKKNKNQNSLLDAMRKRRKQRAGA